MRSAIVLFLLSSSAWAAGSNEVRVLLPGGEAQSILAESKDVAPPEPAKPFDLGFTIGTWAPNLSLDSNVADATNFSIGALPLISTSIVEAPFAAGPAGSLSLRAGVGIEGLKRTGTLNFPGGPQLGEQHALLLPLEAGVEARPAFAQWRDLGFYLDATVNPMFLITERSPLDDGRTAVGIGGGAALGGTYNLRRLVSSDALYLDMNVVARVGELSGGSANGLGVQAGVRLQM